MEWVQSVCPTLPSVEQPQSLMDLSSVQSVAARRAELRMEAAELSGTLPDFTMASEVLRTAAACRSRIAASRADCCFPAAASPDDCGCGRSSACGAVGASPLGFLSATRLSARARPWPLPSSLEYVYGPCAAACQNWLTARLVLGVGACMGRASAASALTGAAGPAHSSATLTDALFAFGVSSSSCDLLAAVRQKSSPAAATGGGDALGILDTVGVCKAAFWASCEAFICGAFVAPASLAGLPTMGAPPSCTGAETLQGGGATAAVSEWSPLVAGLRLKPRLAAISQKLLTSACVGSFLASCCTGTFTASAAAGPPSGGGCCAGVAASGAAAECLSAVRWGTRRGRRGARGGGGGPDSSLLPR